MSARRTKQEPVDMVIFGATGFVGRLTATYLAEHSPKHARLALAGRSQQRLEQVREELPGRASRWPLVVADSGDAASMRALAESARIVITTVGPYYRSGLALVEACAASGTDYIDLTGEVLFMRESIDRCHERAKRSGARIVHGCGFDSIPSDLGVLTLHEAISDAGDGELEETTLVVRALRGGFSGGTIASAMGLAEAVRTNPKLRRVIGDPYALSPDRSREPDLGRQRDPRGVVRDDALDMWLAPFVMAGCNTRVVRRSNALQKWAYGRNFRYQEVVGFRNGLTAAAKAAALSASLTAFATSITFAASRRVVARFLPKPGEGPSERTQRTGFFKIEIHTTTSTGARYIAHVAARGDPGYAATAVMLGESALCLALDREALPDRAGVLTPATALGVPLVRRLRSADHTYDVRRLRSRTRR
jgi:short subunit dehydrogenase-like uncharacterized protein